ncbi:replication-associated recombination protein A [Kosmotoga pacifica]|uniref:Recombinase RarA n=1 Tax=Kosmotoga pacifica TaxID=1330330 RepID=A0A0G2Z5C2_9BACT|nr:recombinase RarA [Kosmotoga pacifica]
MNSSEQKWVPLSERLRPRNFDDLVGQEHLTGKNGIIRRAVQSGYIFSMILFGPPGSGKTTIARLIEESLTDDKYEFIAFSASLQGTADLKKIFDRARQLRRYGKHLVLFVDEIHRLNKMQQDVFLPVVEDGTVTLIGATTENPSFEVNPALLSRCRLLVLRQLSPEDTVELLHRALAKDERLSSLGIAISEELIRILAENVGGDARVALNFLETLYENAAAMGYRELNVDILDELPIISHKRYRKAGEEHYDLISAFIKSMRGSDPDAAVYYMMRMIEAGEDPKFIARRMVILASEDIGLADPMALLVAVAAFQAVERVGLPECTLNLSEAAIYLSVASKSNSVYLAQKTAQEVIKKYPNLEVPLKLRNPVTDTMRKMGYGKDYNYPHDSGGFSRELYLPDKIKNVVFYKPTENGREKTVKARLEKLWKGLKKFE